MTPDLTFSSSDSENNAVVGTDKQNDSNVYPNSISKSSNPNYIFCDKCDRVHGVHHV